MQLLHCVKYICSNNMRRNSCAVREVIASVLHSLGRGKYSCKYELEPKLHYSHAGKPYNASKHYPHIAKLYDASKHKCGAHKQVNPHHPEDRAHRRA